ncbi:MAG: hypothetical protein QF733_08315 [Phycisphaerales bacterium]|nr:hypothetical protein [Phycisphaerales bacterium]
MTATCAIVVLALAGTFGTHHSNVVRPANPVSLAAGDTLGMALMEAAALPTHVVQPTQTAQSEGWWHMPATATVVARSIER